MNFSTIAVLDYPLRSNVNPGGPAQGHGDSLGRMVEVADGHLREAFSGLPYDENVCLIEKTLQPGETVCGVARRPQLKGRLTGRDSCRSIAGGDHRNAQRDGPCWA